MRRTLGLTLALLCPGQVAAQQPDEATFLLRRGRDEVGRETYRLLEGRGRGQPGTTLAATASYPGRCPRCTVQALVSRTPGGALTAFQLERTEAGDTIRILGEVAGGRLTIRIVHGATEAARQHPAGPDLVILADSLHSLFAQVGPLATEAGRRLSGLYPLTGRRVTFTATLGRPGASEARVVEVTGEVEARVAFDGAGRLLRVTLPATGVTAVRADL